MSGKELPSLPSFETNRTGLPEDRKDLKEGYMRAIIFQTFPSRFASPKFIEVQPFDQVGMINYGGGETQVLPGFKEDERNISVNFFTLPEFVIARTKAYVASHYLDSNMNPES